MDMALLPLINPTTCDTEYLESRLECGHDLTSNDLPQSCIPFAMPNLLASTPDIASTPYKGFSSYMLESRLCGTYIPILYVLNSLVNSSFVSLSFELQAVHYRETLDDSRNYFVSPPEELGVYL